MRLYGLLKVPGLILLVEAQMQMLLGLHVVHKGEKTVIWLTGAREVKGNRGVVGRLAVLVEHLGFDIHIPFLDIWHGLPHQWCQHALLLQDHASLTTLLQWGFAKIRHCLHICTD